jgi:hypothetical protein
MICTIAERNVSGKHLEGYEATLSKSCTNGSAMAHLDHDHRKRVYVGFLTSRPSLQDLDRSPAESETVSKCDTPDGVRVLSDDGKAEIRETYPTSVIHKDVSLDGCQCCYERDLEEARTPLRSPWTTLQECR